MKSYVITIMNLPDSVQSAQRCIDSMPEYDVQMFDAITPEKKPLAIAEKKGIPLARFYERYSRVENCVAAFLSHHTLWEKCIEDNVEYQIFEHDAVCVNTLPKSLSYEGCLSLGAPSYGKYITPGVLGVNPLTSKNYFPGAHAYRLKPIGAKALIDEAKKSAAPTDLFLNINRFSWLQEFYPWPIVAKDNFTTIQKLDGCVNKHGYKPGYKIVSF